jgi:hypothetical protein
MRTISRGSLNIWGCSLGAPASAPNLRFAMADVSIQRAWNAPYFPIPKCALAPRQYHNGARERRIT